MAWIDDGSRKESGTPQLPNPGNGACSGEKGDCCDAGSGADSAMTDAGGGGDAIDDGDEHETSTASDEINGKDAALNARLCDDNAAGGGMIEVYHVCGRTLLGRTPTSVR